MRDRHKAARRAPREEECPRRKSMLANNNNNNNNKCRRLCVSVIYGSCWLLLAAAHNQQDDDDDDKWEPPPSPQREINSTASLQDAANQTAANRAKPVLAAGLAELNPDASDTVPVYMQHMTIILCTLHLSVFVTGLVGNSLVCLSVYRNKSLQTITNYYIVNLAVADFLVILICLPPTVYWDLTLTWNFGQVLCKLVLYLQSISVSVSVLTLTCISIDRWYAICRPLKFSSSKSRAKLTIALIWLASLLIASPDVIFLTTSKLYEGEGEVYTDCTYSWPENNTKMYQLCIVTLLFILPFVLMIISYSQIVNVLWRNETMAESMQNSFHLEDEAATAASIGNNGGGGGGGKKLKRRSAKNESVISTTSMATVAAGAGHQDNNGAPRHRWLRRSRHLVPAEECGNNGRTADRLCSTCAGAAAAAAVASTPLSHSNSSNASNASYLVTPSGSFSLRPRSFAILKLCRLGRSPGVPKQLGPTTTTLAPKTNSLCPPADDAKTTGQLVAANIQSHRAARENNNNNSVVCQFKRCPDLKCLNSASGGGNDVDESALVKLNVNNSSPSADCLVGLVCSGPAGKLDDENMEISARSLVNRKPPFADDDDDDDACGFGCDDNNVSLELSTGGELVVTTIRAKQAVDGELLLGQYDNERASLSPTSPITTAADKIGPQIAGPNRGRRWTTSSATLLLPNNNNYDGGGDNLVLGPNYCEHASGQASSGSSRAKCLSTASRAERGTRACDRKSATGSSTITKSCKLHAAADCAQCHADNHNNNNNNDDDDHHDHQNKNNRCHGCRRHLQRRRHHHHRRRRATCHELQEPATVSSAKIIITEIKESGAPVILTRAGANHWPQRPLDVETNEPCGPNGPNGNYYTRRGRRATTATAMAARQDLVDKTRDEGKQGADLSSVKSSLAHNPTGLHGGTVVAADSANEIKSIQSPRRAISAEMPPPITSTTTTTTTSSSSTSSGRANELSEALGQTNRGRLSGSGRRANSDRPGQSLECGDDENDDAARLREQMAAEPAVAPVRQKRNRSNRHHQRHQQQNRHYHDHHHHHCRCRKHTDQSRRCLRRRSKGGQSVDCGGASLSLGAADAAATASVMRGKDEFSAATTGGAAKNTLARHYCAECMPPSCDHVRVASPHINIFDLAAAAAAASETSGLNDAPNRDRALSCTGGGGGEQVVVLTRSTGNGPAGPRASLVATMAAPAATEIVSRIEAKQSELDTGEPLESLKWPAGPAAGHLAAAEAANTGPRSGQLEWAGNDSSPAEDEERRNLLFIASGGGGDGGEGDICARAASGRHEQRRCAERVGPRQSMKQDNKSSSSGGGGRCTWRSSNIRAAAGSACAAMHKGVTYERPASNGGRRGQGWCLDCCDTHERLSPPADPPARPDHHYRQEPPSKLALSALSKQQQQQQQQQHGGRPTPISCDNRQSNGRLSVKLAPAAPDLNLVHDKDNDDNKSGRRTAKTNPLGSTKTAGLSTGPSSLQSINQMDDNRNRASTRAAVKCMVANKFLYIRRFVRLVPSPATGSTTRGPPPPGDLSGPRGGEGRASKCRACHGELDVEPRGRETKVASVGPPSSDPPTTMCASESHVQQTQQQHKGHAPARVSSARSASDSVHANGSASHQQHAQIHNRSSAPLQGSSSSNAAKSCSLVMQTIPASQQQQQHNHYPNHHQPQHHSHPNHSSTRFYKLIESRKKAAKMLIVIVIMFGLCYLPIHFLNTLRYTTGLPQNDITTIASLVSHWLCYFNSAVNPLIYNFMSGKFRHEFANLFFCRFLRRAATNNQNHY